MRHLRLVLLFTAWVLLAGSAFAAPPPPGATPVPPGATAAAAELVVENTPTHHVSANHKPIMVNWNFKNKVGSAHLVVNPDGTYLFSGSYGRKEPYRDLDVALLVVSNSKPPREFVVEYKHDVNTVPAGGLRWSNHGTSEALKRDFKSFESGHDWAGSYRLIWTKGKTFVKEYKTCKEWANPAVAWTAYTMYGEVRPAYCSKFNFS
jgi:hypothetical protein